MKPKQKVAVVQYRSASNYKLSFSFAIPKGLKVKVGEDIDVSEFGISEDEWFNEILPARGFSYDETEDHTLVEIQVVRDMTDDDLCSNVSENGRVSI